MFATMSMNCKDEWTDRQADKRVYKDSIIRLENSKEGVETKYC